MALRVRVTRELGAKDAIWRLTCDAYIRIDVKG